MKNATYIRKMQVRPREKKHSDKKEFIREILQEVRYGGKEVLTYC